MKRLLLVAPIALLAACDAPQTATVATSSDGVVPPAGQVRGTYNPAVMNRDAVIDQIISQCGGSYDHVWETPLDNGMIGYTARCA